MNNKDQYISDLESIMRLLADVWPADRENVAVAGAKFEEFTNEFETSSSQLKKLINLTWEGIKHLFQEDDYFIMVKTATMHAVNIIREYVIEDGDIQVEDFEKVYFELEKALSGGSESADEVIEINQKEQDTSSEAKDEAADAEADLQELAAFIISLDAASMTKGQVKELTSRLTKLIRMTGDEVGGHLQEALNAIKNVTPEDAKNPEQWLEGISTHITKAVEFSNDEEWNQSELSPEMQSPEHMESPSVEPDSEKTEDSGEESEGDEDSAADTFVIPEDFEITMVTEFIAECSELIESAESALLDLEETPDDKELINTVFRAFHTIKGTSAFMGLEPVSEFTHFVETLLSMVREDELEFDMACADITLESIDIINQLLAKVEKAHIGDTIRKSAQFTSMMKVLNEISMNGISPSDALKAEKGDQAKAMDMENVESAVSDSDEAGEAASENEANEKNSSKSESESSVRVSVNRLDRLIDMVGELVIAHSVVAQDESIPSDSDLHKKVNHATKILRELQDTSLTLRMVPLKATFHKMNRLVRDLSRKAGKRVKFNTIGEDTEIDRNMVDIINEPLVHMLRNALDHGIEEPDERIENGKDKTANISLRASQEGGKVVIEIQDDGRGIDKDKILEKAIEKNLIDPDKKLSEEEIYNLIFLPGFSSAEKVTDLSGRGVGMDVVRRSIEELHGKVDVSSELGAGTKITIELPFTLAITDGMLVRVGSERFIIPTINIDMTFRVEERDLFTVMGNSEQVTFRGQSVPVIRLYELFEIEEAEENLLEGTLLVIKNNNSRYALLVDEVIGQQQLVGKSIDMKVKMNHISGGAILGDGRVGLILDTATLMDFAA